MVRNALTNILANAELLQRKPGLTQEEKGRLEEIKKDTYGIARILHQARPQNCKKFLGGILDGLKEIKEILLEK